MDNVYLLRSKQKLFFTLPSDFAIDDVLIVRKKIAIFVNLFYLDDCFYYFNILKKIQGIDIYVISSCKELLELAKKWGFLIIQKENRGRDLSALLISSKSYFFNYDYVCFFHDKKAHNGVEQKIIDSWLNDMIENTIISKEFIVNVVNLFETHDEIGLLVPPEPCDDRWEIYGQKLWQIDFNNTKDLCDSFDLNCNLSYEYPPITIGTVFWCRPIALKKLFQRKWEYSDFPEEPMKSGGTLNHALERSFAYFAQDAGYLTGTIMSDKYASKRMDFYTTAFSNIMNFLNHNGFCSYYWFDNFLCDCKIVRIMRNLGYPSLFIYGAGKIANQFFQSLIHIGYIPNGFIVSQKEGNPDTILGFSVIEIDSVTDRNAVIIIAVGKNYQETVRTVLKEHGFDNVYLYDEL